MAGKAADLHHKIGNILLREWDPIGINDIPEAQDEYEGYIHDILSMLTSGKNVNDIYNYLLWAEAEHMGLDANRENAHIIAIKLVSLSN